jgi:hypothetical protein
VCRNLHPPSYILHPILSVFLRNQRTSVLISGAIVVSVLVVAVFVLELSLRVVALIDSGRNLGFCL